MLILKVLHLTRQKLQCDYSKPVTLIQFQKGFFPVAGQPRAQTLKKRPVALPAEGEKNGNPKVV